VNSVCVLHDAISAAIRNEIDWLSGTTEYDVKLFSYRCDFESLPYKNVDQVADLVFDPHFQSSEIVIFHFGIYYPLFNAIAVTPLSARRLVVFHNITPKQFVAPVNHPTIDRSFRQMGNLLLADHIACDSQTNLDVLRAAGVETPASVLPLAVNGLPETVDSKPHAVDGLVRLAFVGRFVRSKGPVDLLEALRSVLERDPSLRLQLEMVGNLSFSDPDVLVEVRSLAQALQSASDGRARVTLHGNATDEVKSRILRDADIFVLPTYHEGFCVPVLEALAHGCKVVAYDNSNLPAVCGGFGRLVPTGDIDLLSRAIGEAIAEIGSPAWRGNDAGSYSDYVRNTLRYVRQHSPERSRQRFVEFVQRFAH